MTESGGAPPARRPRRVRRVAAIAGALVATALLLEAGVWAGVELGLLDTPAPLRGGTGFWRGHHPQLGVWHEPDAEYRHRMRCFDVTYRTNSVGARDVERPLHSDEPRVVVLGDSFLEGWGVEREERFSEQLERASGIPHLNFAMSHFGPYQQLVAYETLARRFDHAGVIASVVPLNDFLDLTFERARFMDHYAYRYRPYLVPRDGGFEHLDYHEPLLRRLLRRQSYAFNALLAAQRSLDERSSRRPFDPNVPQPRVPSDFFDVPERELRILEEVLERLVRATEGRPLAVVLVPARRDLQRYRRSRGRGVLAPRLKELARRRGFYLVDLLPGMSIDRASEADYFHACDPHWSARGHEVAAEITYQWLRGGFYASLRR